MKKQEIERDFVKELTREAEPAIEAKYMPKDARIDSKVSDPLNSQPLCSLISTP